MDQTSFEEMEMRAVQAKEEAEKARKRVKDVFSTVIRLALDALSEKALVFFSLSLTAGAFAWSLADPSVLRTATATIFAGVLILAGVFKKGGDNGAI